MQRTLLVFVLGNMVCLVGCNEFVSQSSTVKATTVDVVGDPSDPAPDSMEQADILGAALPVADRSDDTESDSVTPNQQPVSDETGLAGGKTRDVKTSKDRERDPASNPVRTTDRDIRSTK